MVVFQGLLFGDENEARAEHLARRARDDEAKAVALARKAAWDAGEPFPDDQARWAAAHRELTNARSREAYRQSYPECSGYYQNNSARYRAEKLGCKIGRRGPLLARYELARSPGLIPCYWCKYLTKPGERHVDHIRSLARGGEHAAGNLRITCIDCNLSKGDAMPEEFRDRIKFKRSLNCLSLKAYYIRLQPPR